VQFIWTVKDEFRALLKSGRSNSIALVTAGTKERMMTHVLQVDFPYPGPFGAAMATDMAGLAQDIAAEPGLIWKIWTENAETGRAGGIYLFQTPAQAEAYATKHLARLAAFGITGIVAHHFAVNGPLSAATRFAA
jgi:hypothetical protein